MLDYSHFPQLKAYINTNQFVNSQTGQYTPQQKELHNYINSMQDRVMSCRQITELLNEKNIPTHKGKKWDVFGNSVYSVLKKSTKIRENRI